MRGTTYAFNLTVVDPCSCRASPLLWRAWNGIFNGSIIYGRTRHVGLGGWGRLLWMGCGNRRIVTAPQRDRLLAATLCVCHGLQIGVCGLGIATGNRTHGLSNHLVMAGHTDRRTGIVPMARRIVELVSRFLIFAGLG